MQTTLKHHTNELLQKNNSFVVRVAVPLALPKLLNYSINSLDFVQVGSLVEVEVGRKKYHGVVMEVNVPHTGRKLKQAIIIENTPPLAEQTVQFYKFSAKYTLSMPGEAVRAAFIGGKIPELPAPQKKIFLTGKAPQKNTAARKKVIEAAGNGGWSVEKLATESGVSSAVVRGLIKQGVFAKKVFNEGDEFNKNMLNSISLPPLESSQKKAADYMAGAMYSKKFAPFLLDGTMGSGKTEVYFDTIARMLEGCGDEAEADSNGGSGGVFLILLPEIALTPQWITRFEKRFGFAPDVWHSGISKNAKSKTWWRILQGKARVVVGARSALFLPFNNLRFIVVDEEHDPSYKQADGFRYHGRDMAVALASIWRCPVVLASATPSLETWYNIQTGKYKHLVIKGRYGSAKMPKVYTVDMKKHAPKTRDHWLSPILVRAVGERLERGEQSLLFLNRRGVAPLMICGGCGYRFACPSCDVALVVHASAVRGGSLMCHHCGFQEKRPDECPKCGDDEKLRAFGPGTRKISTEIMEHFPTARIAVADSDAITTTAQMAELVRRMESCEIDILVGTQMVAKGHHFPKLTFVGVVDADMGLTREDPRAAERTFQTLMQVAGRAGREEREGEVLLQSYTPQHPLFQSLIAGERDNFFKLELQARKEFSDPPYGRQAAIIISGVYQAEVLEMAQKLAQAFPQNNPEELGVSNMNPSNITLLGPAEAPIARLRGKYRYRLLVKSSKPVQKVIANWLANVPISGRVRVDIDIDPVNFF